MEALGEYVSVLARCARVATAKSDLHLYQLHLADAARMLAAIREGDEMRLAEVLWQNHRAFGTSYLSGDEGETACSAMMKFAKFAESRLESQAAKNVFNGRDP